MLVYIDEGGHSHLNNAATRPVVTAVCISDRDSRIICGTIHALKE